MAPTATAADSACRNGVSAISCKCLILRWAAPLVVRPPQRAALQHSALAIRPSSLAPLDDQGYLFSLIVVSANRMKLVPVAAPGRKK